MTLSYHDCLMIDIPSFDVARGGNSWWNKIIDEAEVAMGVAVNRHRLAGHDHQFQRLRAPS